MGKTDELNEHLWCQGTWRNGCIIAIGSALRKALFHQRPLPPRKDRSARDPLPPRLKLGDKLIRKMAALLDPSTMPASVKRFQQLWCVRAAGGSAIENTEAYDGILMVWQTLLREQEPA